MKGSAPLSSRYLVNKEGILVDAGTALAPGAVSSITPCGKYLSLIHIYPVGHGVLCALLALDGACLIDGSAVQQQLFGQSGICLLYTSRCV